MMIEISIDTSLFFCIDVHLTTIDYVSYKSLKSFGSVVHKPFASEEFESPQIYIYI